jgi:hypothetical protein
VRGSLRADGFTKGPFMAGPGGNDYANKYEKVLPLRGDSSKIEKA